MSGKMSKWWRCKCNVAWLQHAAGGQALHLCSTHERQGEPAQQNNRAADALHCSVPTGSQLRLKSYYLVKLSHMSIKVRMS
jgi:hypothetical protein